MTLGDVKIKKEVETFLSLKRVTFQHWDAPPHFSIPECTNKLMWEIKEKFPKLQQDVHPRHYYSLPTKTFEYVIFYNN